MEAPNPGQVPQPPPDYFLPKTSQRIFPALKYDENHEDDFFLNALLELGQTDSELARQLIAAADRWAREDFPEEDQEYERANARSRYINMGLFVYKSLERQGLVNYFAGLLAADTPAKPRSAVLSNQLPPKRKM